MSAASRVLSLSRKPSDGFGLFSDRAVPHELLSRILDCARYAPSAKEGSTVATRRSARCRNPAPAGGGGPFNHPLARSAPVLVVACARIHTHISGKRTPESSCGCVGRHREHGAGGGPMWGLATTWITGYRETVLRDLLQIPKDVSDHRAPCRRISGRLRPASRTVASVTK